MDHWQIAALLLLSVFYISYIAKTIMLKRQNIKADLLGKGQKPSKEAVFETALKIMTYLGAAIQFVSTIWNNLIFGFFPIQIVSAIGLTIMQLGIVIFISAMATMRENWRAGYSDEQKTNLVTNGIYKYSRNPAFLGFDFLYIGCALVFPNVLNILCSVAVIVLFHIQILGEERFLEKTFGEEYLKYKKSALRYFGCRKG